MPHAVTIRAKMTDDRPPDNFPDATAWRVELRYRGRRLTVPFYTGPMAGEPTAAGVLECLTSDAYAGEQTFADFCADYGYDEDSRNAERTWRACSALTPRLRRFLRHDFEQVAELARESRDGTVIVRFP